VGIFLGNNSIKRYVPEKNQRTLKTSLPVDLVSRTARTTIKKEINVYKITNIWYYVALLGISSKSAILSVWKSGVAEDKHDLKS
jgi:hypothetical protein